ncbi:hypothetical protein SLEP1_g45588 [Rubroshorea leprosula]|uniref:Nucleoplasmin-like domain-containing protein n=1 Tax=Rubroshorea leprosula TaxID=152421 RepID=A0AAV5LJU0_9ROSI|nr:hypothetical protein SLEP1_g45588 [Rubroshorea leprosula]
MEGSTMSFFGVEVKSGQSLKVEPSRDKVLHLSQAALGEVTGDAKKDKGNESVYLYLKFDGQKFVLGTLSHDKFPLIPFDLVFEKEFELSHSWKIGSVYVSGYYVYYQSKESDVDELELPAAKTDTTEPTAKQVKIVEPKKEEDGGDDNHSSDEDDSSNDDESNDDQDQELLHNGENESDEDSESDEEDSDDESSDEDQETPEKVEPSKKRSAEPSTPVPGKKAKVENPVKAGMFLCDPLGLIEA